MSWEQDGLQTINLEQKGMKNLSEDEISYFNIKACWKELEKYITIAFAGKTLPHKKQSRKDAEDSIVDKIACRQHATLPKLNSSTTPPRNHNKQK